MAEFPRHIVTPDGEVTLASARDEFLYNNFKFASARKAGNVIYVSGVIAGPEKGEGRGVDDFKNQLRRAFGQIGATLKARSEEHTSELQSRRDLVCRLLLEKKKKKKTIHNIS